MPPTPDEIAGQQRRLESHRVTLAHYLDQLAQLGSAYAPPGVTAGIHEARQGIARCKAALRGWGVALEDHPDDEAPPPSAPASTAEVERGLRAALPSEPQPALADLARLLTDLVAGDLGAEDLRERLTSAPALAQLLKGLVGQQVPLGATAVSFGEGAQVGDVTIRDIAGGDLVNLTVNIYPSAPPGNAAEAAADATPAAGPLAGEAQSPPRAATTPPAAGDRGWPPSPDFSPLDAEQRQQAFGVIEWVRASGTSIKITNNFAKENIVTVRIPQLAKINGAPENGTIYCHKLAARQFAALWAAWEEAGLLDRVLSYDGSFVPRTIRFNSRDLSVYSWGIAFDINVRWNGFMKLPAAVGAPGSVRELVPIANQLGFWWGGHWNYDGKGAADGSHFEVARLLP